jgi:hypothetical protein
MAWKTYPLSVLQQGCLVSCPVDRYFLRSFPKLTFVLSGAADRETTRPEDKAYSLLGIFGVNMPILYGEGERNAFFRLQVMIYQTFSDHSIFAWRAAVLPCTT